MLATAEITAPADAKPLIEPATTPPATIPTIPTASVELPIVAKSATRKSRDRGRRTQTEESKRHRLKQAVFFTESLVESGKEMREQLSQPAHEKEDADAVMVRKRAAAGILSRLAMAWRTVAVGIAELKGEPTPGQKRPIPDELKAPKPVRKNAAPDEP